MMKHGFKREDGSFSLCVQNCGLCPMKIHDMAFAGYGKIYA